ncbi:hypothetical protein [Gordonia sp. NPDC003429]
MAIDIGSDEETLLFRGNWTLGPLLQWLADNEREIREGHTPLIQHPGETIARTLERAYSVLDEDLPDNLFELAAMPVSAYLQSHCLAAGMPGMAGVPRLLIGLGRDGMEISKFTDEDSVSASSRYLFDIDDFYTHLPSFDVTGDHSSGLRLSADQPKAPPAAVDSTLRLVVRRSSENSSPDSELRTELIAQRIDDHRERILFSAGQDALRPILLWLRGSEEHIRSDRPPIEMHDDETLGQMLARASRTVSDDLPKEDLIALASKSLSDYIEFHCLPSAAAVSTSGPAILLGFATGRGFEYFEICNRVDGEYAHDTPWSIRFDPDDFFAHLPAE